MASWDRAEAEAYNHRLEVRQIMCNRECGGHGADCIHFGEYAMSDAQLGIPRNPSVDTFAATIIDRFAVDTDEGWRR